MDIMKLKLESYEQIKTIIESLNGYNDDVAINGIKTRIEMTEQIIKNELSKKS